MSDICRLEVKQKIQVSKESRHEWYFSSVLQVDGETFSIAVPRLKTETMTISKGDVVSVKYFDDSASYYFKSTCLERRSGTVPTYLMSCPREVRRVQQRHHVRIPTSLEIYYSLLPTEKDQRPTFKKGISLDVSGGGMRFISEETFPPDTELLIRFYLPTRDILREISVVGTVVRLSVTEIDKKSLFQVGVRFNNISKAQQEQIVNYVFGRSLSQGDQQRVSTRD